MPEQTGSREHHLANSDFQSEKQRYEPDFSFLINKDGDNAQMQEGFEDGYDRWRRLSINGSICYAGHRVYSDDGLNSAGGPYENYAITGKGKIILTKGSNDILWKENNYEKPPLEVAFEDIDDEKIKQMLLGDDILPEKTISETFFRKRRGKKFSNDLYETIIVSDFNRAAIYKRYQNTNDFHVIKEGMKIDNSDRKIWTKKDGKSYEIFERNFFNGSGPKIMSLIPDEVRYAVFDSLHIPEKIDIMKELQQIPVSVLSGAVRASFNSDEEMLEKVGHSNIKEYVSSVADLIKNRPETQDNFSNLIDKMRSDAILQSVHSSTIVPIPVSDYYKREGYNLKSGVRVRKDRFSEIFEYTDKEGSKWHIDQANINSVAGRNYFVKPIARRLEKRMPLSEIDDKFARELLQGKYRVKPVSPIKI